jgi:hypothetical protein
MNISMMLYLLGEDLLQIGSCAVGLIYCLYLVGGHLLQFLESSEFVAHEPESHLRGYIHKSAACECACVCRYLPQFAFVPSFVHSAASPRIGSEISPYPRRDACQGH